MATAGCKKIIDEDRAHDPDGPALEVFEQTVAKARGGSAEALGALLERERNYLLWLAGRELDTQVRAKGGASDVVQQTFLSARIAFDQFQGRLPRHLRAWLRRILLNNVARVHRDYLQTEKRSIAREASLHHEAVSSSPIRALAHQDGTPSSILAHREEEERLLAVLESLPNDYRLVIRLRYWQRLTFREIGTEMNRSAEAARKLWARAIEQLERKLGPPAGSSTEAPSDLQDP
jgi:RNA polymerase sigma-70 factor (ECF subfamily)